MNATRATPPAYGAKKEAREIALQETRRRLVLDGAWRVFAEQGLDGATMRAIATEAGCTTGAIYPIFASKEAVYAALLSESLERLYGEVIAAVGRAGPASARLHAAAGAFLAYYRARPDEVALGLYLWQGVRPRGLTPELDADLNTRLSKTLDLLSHALISLGRLSEAEARVETAALFSFLIGVLIVHQTGRLRLLKTDLERLATAHLEALVARLETGSGDNE